MRTLLPALWILPFLTTPLVGQASSQPVTGTEAELPEPTGPIDEPPRRAPARPEARQPGHELSGHAQPPTPAMLAIRPRAALGRTGVCLIEVLRGRVLVMDVAGELLEVRPDAPRTIHGRAHLEVPAGARARISWVGHASATIEGPSAMEWRILSTPAATSPLPTVAATNLQWTLFDLAEMDLEVRRGAHRLRLPGDWYADLGHGAYGLLELPSGPIEMRHHAGAAAVLRWSGDRRQARPPLTLAPGTRLRIDRPLPGRVDGGRRAESWEDARWPWRLETDDAADRAERMALVPRERDGDGAPDVDAPVLSIRGFAAPTGVRSEVTVPPPTGSGGTPVPEPVGEPRRWRTSAWPLDGRVAAQAPRPESLPGGPGARAKQPVRQGTAPASTTDPAARAAWRHLTTSQLAGGAPLWIEKCDALTVTRLASGRTQVVLDGLAEEPAWCFGPDADWELRPGSVLVFGPNGERKLGFGPYERHPRLEGR